MIWKLTLKSAVITLLTCWGLISCQDDVGNPFIPPKADYNLCCKQYGSPVWIFNGHYVVKEKYELIFTQELKAKHQINFVAVWEIPSNKDKVMYHIGYYVKNNNTYRLIGAHVSKTKLYKTDFEKIN
mgnify:CR=1 FL=1